MEPPKTYHIVDRCCATCGKADRHSNWEDVWTNCTATTKRKDRQPEVVDYGVCDEWVHAEQNAAHKP